MLAKNEMLDLLKADVVPALGCTEPVCVALCAATATKQLGGIVTSAVIEVNPGIYKNGMSAGIPNCKEVGLDYAAALGCILSNPEKKLELLGDIDEEIQNKAEALILEKRITVKIRDNEKSLFVRCEIKSEKECVVCEIRGAHTNVVYLEKNNQILIQKEITEGKPGEDPILTKLKAMTIFQMRDLVDSASEEDLHFLLDGVMMNEQLADYSETHDVGVGITGAIREETKKGLLKSGLLAQIITKVSSAAESRLDGCPLPAMSSSGAGTKGLVVTLPISETARAIGAGNLELERAIALGHLVNRYANAYIGKLSPMCTCVMAASTASSVGITYLLGGNNEQLGYAVRNMVGSVTGMICDGGKVGCSMKVAVGSIAALLSAFTAIHDAPLRASDGILADSPEECIWNMAKIGNEGMAETDRTILKLIWNSGKRIKADSL